MARNSYFSFFDNIVLNNVQIKNIFTQFKLRESYKNNKNIFKTYYVKDNETIEDLALRWYEDKQLFWIIMLSNDMKDFLYDFPMMERDLRVLAQKYYDNGDKTGSLDSIFTELVTENDVKRDIYFLDPELLDEFLYYMKNVK